MQSWNFAAFRMAQLDEAGPRVDPLDAQAKPFSHGGSREAGHRYLEQGLEHQDAMPDVPAPEELPTFGERLRPLAESLRDEAEQAWLERDRPIDSRYVTEVAFLDPPKLAPRMEVWIRADGRLPESLLLQQCVVAYASDMTLLDTAILPHGISWFDRTYTVASLDHAMWFHRAFRADEWLLYVQESPAAAAGRAFSTGKLFSREGHLVASVVQEGLIRKL